MIVPFQALMIPFMALFAPFVSLNNQVALIFFYVGFGVALSTFLYHGFISNIPTELDEAAAIDGASDMTIFWRIIFPMLKPVTATVAIVNALWIWNDFLLPRLVLTPETQTLPLSTYLFYGQYATEYGQAMAGLFLAVIPIIIFYLILQRQFISGISTGAVK
jgi:raffinose/stachyose/melibiose transport system permease protein